MAVDAKPVPPLADPAPLGLGAFALTTFILRAHNAFGAKTVPLLAFFGFGLFYGGLAQFMAGMFEFRNKNVFGATAFTTYGGFWLGLSAVGGPEILLAIGNFNKDAAGSGVTALGGYVGLLTAATAWYASAAGVVNGMAGRPVVPVGNPLWADAPPS